MKEKLIDIVSSVDSFNKISKGKNIYAVARIRCLSDGVEETIWLVDRYPNTYDCPEVNTFGRFALKNSHVAIKMQTHEVGNTFEYEQLNRIRCVTLENRTNTQNHTIEIAGDDIKYQYRNIEDFLHALKQNNDDISDIESKIAELKQTIEDLKQKKNTADQRRKISKSIKELEKEYRILTQQQEDLKNITIYIRKQGEMRYSLIVDTIQTRIKSQNLYDGKTVIIDGGPGTGKSTTMIHRLAYLTDIFAIDEDEKNNYSNYKLNRYQRQSLRNAIESQRDWMFFSPSKMLKDYMAEAMKKEGLKNASQKVWNWKDYCPYILQVEYGLLGDSDNKSPFRVSKFKDTLFFQNSNIVKDLNDFYLNQFRNISASLPQINSEATIYEWTSIALNIKKRFENSDSFDIHRFISLFLSLESVYGEDCKKILREKSVMINELSLKICELLSQEKKIKSDIEDYLNLAEFDETEDDTDDESINISNSEETEELAEESDTHNDKLLKEIQKWLTRYCFTKVNNKSKLSDVYQLVSEILVPAMEGKFNSHIQKIGELMIFEQFAQYTRGVKTIVLNGIPGIYKKFRKYLSKSKYEGCDLKLLRDIMQRGQGKELHHQEMSLLLGFINNLIKDYKKATRNPIKHPYFDAYEEVSRPIIGIDEATDFSACDIYAMESLLTLDYNSLTLCGDMMQRMTSYGIKSWSELNGIVSDPLVVEMETSYRQSRKMLEVARQLYIDTLNAEPNYKAFMKSKKVPDPLVYISESEFSKVQWISDRISEVYRAYGEQLPSIAIFVNDKGYIPRFIELLQQSEFFTKNKVKITDGTNGIVRMDTDHICVYPIDVVKGMEFDVVFFHNIDNSSEEVEVLKRYIYVGVSRAAFFLGITLNKDNEEICKYFKRNKDWFKI